MCVCASIHIRPHSEHQEAVRAFSRNAAIWWPTEGITTLSHFPEFDRAVWCVLCVFYDACTTRKQMMDQILARLWAVPLLPPPFWTQSFLFKDTTEAFFFSSFLAAVYLLHHFILSDFGAEQQKCVRVLCQLSPSRHSKLSNKSSGVPPRGLPVSLALISPSFFYTAVTANSLSGEQVFPIRSRWRSVSLFADEASVFLLVFWVVVDRLLLSCSHTSDSSVLYSNLQFAACQLFCGHVTKHKFRLKYAQLISNKKAFTGRCGDIEPTSGPLKTNCDLKLRCKWLSEDLLAEMEYNRYIRFSICNLTATTS